MAGPPAVLIVVRLVLYSVLLSPTDSMFSLPTTSGGLGRGVAWAVVGGLRNMSD